MELNKIYCAESSEFLKENIDSNFIDLTVTSPPYDNLRDYKGYKFDYKPLAQQLFRVTKDGGVVVWIAGDQTKNFCESLSSFKQALFFVEICGFNLLDTMIYEKLSYAPGYPTMRRYVGVFEYMFVFSKGKPKTFNSQKEPISKKESSINRRKYSRTTTMRQKDGSKIIKRVIDNGIELKNRTNVWKYLPGGNYTNDKFALKHPAVFPENLAKDHILTWTNENDVVLDPMCGSGTTCKMALINKRNFIGIDISEEYVNCISIPRINSLVQLSE